MKTTLAQWRALQAVVDHGGFAQAAAVLNRSQSSVSYAVGRLEESLGVRLLKLSGRRARLTDAGSALLRGARNLLSEARELESLAATLAEGWEAELSLAVDGLCPEPLLSSALEDFASQASATRVEISEEVLSGASEAISEGRVDLALSPEVPGGFLGEPILEVAFLPVAHPDHALNGLNRSLTNDDLRRERQIVIRDSARQGRRDHGWLGAPRRWTVTSLESARRLVTQGLGFAWLPAPVVAADIDSGRLRQLQLQAGGGRRSHLYLVVARPNSLGPAARLLVDCLRTAAADYAAP
ncbi:LysR family transcriptional regulator [Natronospira bacteriovora]|uniref:LysR family transcriptional regulator n=1 Tax=Natronospira bacteriovora TaxID=3069753 RepID=A0ABU0W4Z8_9GAMM|nr:LysR family transcriptional regulator [Natronospira sp. AB-CW4]MDQ2069095.1 LysR family transcriptional regulator [Natronospira sp. AB-CW4]